MDTSSVVLIVVLIMGGFLVGAVYIGFHYSKKSAQKLRDLREKELQNREK